MEKSRKRSRNRMKTENTTGGAERNTILDRVANLTEDLIIDILLCLPVKSIARFSCVCKSWYNLLTNDTRFASMKLDHDTRKRNLKLLLTTRKCNKYGQDAYKVELRSVISDEPIKLTYPFKKHCDSFIQILGSCNGLICAGGYYTTYVWNPCTKEYKVIMSWEKPIGFQTRRNCMNDYIGYGFGYDSKTCDYKFVSIFKKQHADESQVEIYNLGSDSWRTYGSSIPYRVSKGNPGVFLNGALHWLARTGNNISSQPRVILSFDLEDETFKEVPQPQHIMGHFDYRFVDVLRGRLCLLCSVCDGFEIWEMKEYGVRESWSKLFKSDQQLMMTLDIPSYRYLRSAVSLPNGETLLQFRLYGGDDEMYSSYEWHKKYSVVEVCLEKKERHRQNARKYRYKKHMAVQMGEYMESLVSVNSGTRVGDKQEEEDYFEAIKNVME